MGGVKVVVDERVRGGHAVDVEGLKEAGAPESSQEAWVHYKSQGGEFGVGDGVVVHLPQGEGYVAMG